MPQLDPPDYDYQIYINRAHLIRKYTYPSSAVERALTQLADLYVQKGHDLRSCRQALQKSLRLS